MECNYNSIYPLWYCYASDTRNIYERSHLLSEVKTLTGTVSNENLCLNDINYFLKIKKMCIKKSHQKHVRLVATTMLTLNKNLLFTQTQS